MPSYIKSPALKSTFASAFPASSNHSFIQPTSQPPGPTSIRLHSFFAWLRVGSRPKPHQKEHMTVVRAFSTRHPGPTCNLAPDVETSPVAFPSYSRSVTPYPTTAISFGPTIRPSIVAATRLNKLRSRPHPPRLKMTS
jgi:hypothetical protein